MDTVTQIKEKLDIVEVLRDYITLKPSGSNMKASCPFHSEKSASFMVSPSKQIWHCFGCGLGGDIFGFVMRFESLEFREALNLLAKKAGVEIKYEATNTAQRDESQYMVKLTSFAVSVYQKFLYSKLGADARKYIEERRGLNASTIKYWQVGYAPDGFDNLLKLLKQKKILESDMISAGLVVKNEKGQLYDRFRNRVMFPIKDFFGQVVGFTARALDDVATAKYINSPENNIYHKSKVMFGLFEAKEAIRKKGFVIVVEGQMDVIASHQSGMINCVATSGTALTTPHLKLLKRLTSEIVFCFDGDSAGQAALWTAVRLSLGEGFRVKAFKVSGEAKDPDELIRRSAFEWEKEVKDAKWAIDYFMEKVRTDTSEDSLTQKKEIEEKVLPLLAVLEEGLERDHFIKKLETEFYLSTSTVKKILTRLSLGLKQTAPEIVADSQKVELLLLGSATQYPEFGNFVLANQVGFTFVNPEIERLWKNILRGGLEEKDNWVAKEADFVLELEKNNLNDENLLVMELKKIYARMALLSLSGQLSGYTRQLKDAEMKNNHKLKQTLTGEFLNLLAKQVALQKVLESL